MKTIRGKRIRCQRFAAWGVVLGGVAAACQPTAPSSELVAARRVYDQARQSAAAELDPTSVDQAQTSLEAAEAAHHEAPRSQRERSHAYISIRKSELAMSRAREAAAREEQERIARARGALLGEAEAEQARADLDQRERELRAALVALAITQLEGGAEGGALAAQEHGAVRVTGVFFDTGRDELSADARRQLDIVAGQLEAAPELYTVVEGFADARGDAEQNLALSQRRANRVKEYLSSRGVDIERVEAVGLGESYPVASNTTPGGRATNRRAEVSTGAEESQPSARAVPPASEEDAPMPDEPAREPDEESPRQPVKGDDRDYPDDPQSPREPENAP